MAYCVTFAFFRINLNNKFNEILDMRKLKLFFLLLFAFNALAAQNTGKLKGTVVDAKTGEKLFGVNVFLENTTIGTSTNAEGRFSLSGIQSGAYILTASFLGYEQASEKVRVENGATQSLSFFLKESAQSLQEVTILAKSKARKLRERAAPISVISMNQLSGTVNSISDVLTKTVGVTLRSSGGVGSASRLSVRGLEGKRIGFFIDETPMNDHSDFIDINDIPMELIDRIEIYKGVVPAKFGGSSMGGAVNLVIKEYPERYADFSYTHESFNVHKVQTILKRNIKDKGMTIGIGGGYTYADNDYTMESPHIKGLKIKRNHDNFKKLLIGGGLTAKNWWFDEVEFEPVFIDTYREIQGIENDVREALMTSRAYLLANALEKDNFLTPGLDFDMSAAVAHTQYSLVDKAEYWYDWQGNAYKAAHGGELGNSYASNSDNKKFTLIHKLNLEYLLREQHTLNFNSFFTLANGNPKDDLRDSSYGKQTVFDSKMRSWITGLTYDYRTRNDKFLNSFTTRYYLYTMTTKHIKYGIGKAKDIDLNKSGIGVSNAMRYRFTSKLMGKLSAGYDVRIPAETELLGDGAFIIPAENLTPERNTSVNIGMMYDLTGKHPSNLQLELNGFYTYLKDMIRFTASFVGAQYQNFGKMETLGVEFEAKADMFPFLYGYANITYQDLRDVREFEENSTITNPSKDKRMPNIPYFFANAGLEFHKENLFGGSGQNTRIFADMSFVEEYFYDFELTKLDKRRIPRSTRLDLGFEHSLMNQSLFISGKVNNATDAKLLSEFNHPLPGRSFAVKLRYVLK